MSFQNLPDRSRLVKIEDYDFGISPFDGMTREELLRLTQAFYASLVSARTSLRQARLRDENSPMWAPDGLYGRGLARAEYMTDYVEDESAAYYAFFRYANPLMFDEPGEGWMVEPNGEITKTLVGQPSPDSRPLEFSDIKPSRDSD